MSLLEKLRKDLSNAIHAKDAVRTSVLRMLFAAIKNKEIEERKKEVGLGETEVLDVIHKEAKKRKDAIAEFEKGARADLARAESDELKILEEYLPMELSDVEVRRIIQDGIRELGNDTGPKAFGSLMKIIMPTLKNRASGDRITRLAKEALESDAP